MTHFSSLKQVFGIALLCGTVLIAKGGESRDYLRSNLASSWNPGDELGGVQSSCDLNRQWWSTFEDPMLDSLIALGERNNYDVAVAARRIEISRQALRQAESAYYPQIGLSLGWQRDRQSGRLAGRSGLPVTSSYFSGTANMSWEVDVFGKIRAQAKRGKAQVKVSAAEYDGALVALDAEIASTYINLLVYRAQLAVAKNHSENQKHILDITETRHRTGLVSKLDVAQASTLYYSTIASIPLLEASIEASYNSLAVLLGTTKDNLPEGLFADCELPDHYPMPALCAPIDLLRRRPDIVAAERSIEVAAASLGIARSAYLPSLSIAASAGTDAHAFGDLFSGPSFSYSIAPALSWTLFDGLSRRAATLEARRELENEVDNYNLTVITAIEEVRTAIARYKATQEYISRTAKVVENSEEAVRLSLDQYKQGLTDFYNVAEAQLNYLTYQNSLVSARGNALTALIDLYKALGGGYSL